MADWTPDTSTVERANLTSFMEEVGVDDYPALHRWSLQHRGEFWDRVIRRLGIEFEVPYSDILVGGAEDASWCVGGRLNIATSCFQQDPEKVAIIYGRRDANHEVTYGQLHAMANRVANGFTTRGLAPGEPVAIAMPMTVEAVAAYLGIILAGGVVVSIADSFAAQEIAARLRITNTKIVVTQDRYQRGGKQLEMFSKVVEAGAAQAIVVGADAELRTNDVAWEDFLGGEDYFIPVTAAPNIHTNILFSSGTTGDPKAIPWSHLTPIKAAMDGHFHQDIHRDDVVAWPTNLGWMMGPWLIYGSLINGAALALFDDTPGTPEFTRFVADAGVTVLGVVPSLVAAWRANGALDGVDWSGIRLFSSTGEASNSDDMSWLMATAGGKPVIEYCGGTEIGGGYITGTVVQPAVAGTFSTPGLGLDVHILDDAAEEVHSGELFLEGPSIGLSTELLNRDHHDVYFADTPRGLRRHGDHMEKLDDGYYRALGRIDDTMNLGGIKISSAEIERVVGDVGGVAETAAIAVSPPEGGPSQLVLFAVAGAGVEL
ncbi:MAG: AMP-binding protein, partial [Acidimicrobiia bacterium]|nr:AMP-binding protein [Acidimicrobiia bacterium]